MKITKTGRRIFPPDGVVVAGTKQISLQAAERRRTLLKEALVPFNSSEASPQTDE